jgi:hypothetical protein
MANEVIKADTGKKTTLLVVISIIIAFLVYYASMSMMGPAQTMAGLKARYGVQPPEENPLAEGFFTDSAYVGMMKQKAFLQARIAMAETDSVSLSLNLSDSTAILEINGVMVHTAKMREIQMSKILRSGDVNLITSMLSTPGSIVRDFATIKKEPLMIKMAPKDTSEFKPDIIPDTSDYEPVGYILELERGLRLFVYQVEQDTAPDRRKLKMFDLKDRMRTTWSSMKKVAVFKVPEYQPYIKIRLTRADAKIIYRAIPRKGQVAVYI